MEDVDVWGRNCKKLQGTIKNKLQKGMRFESFWIESLMGYKNLKEYYFFIKQNVEKISFCN